MDSEHPEMEQQFDRVDADAVCEACGTVNPPGTLLCKVCGNNLRDQRLRRMTGDGIAEAAVERVHPRRALSALLAIMGLLTILWTALNVWNGNIDRWMTEGFSAAQSREGEDPTVFWYGAKASVYDELVDAMQRDPITRGEMNVALGGQTANYSDLTGRYLVMRSGRRLSRVGEAAARQVDDKVYFVALLPDAEGTQIRGEATLSDSGTLETKLAGVRSPEGIEGGYGFVEFDEEVGGLVCFGSTWNSEGNAVTESHLFRLP
ncbi:MAG: hypothetical protein GY851_23525 [bacterium]|nr:hypothetical protein [bacterium]